MTWIDALGAPLCIYLAHRIGEACTSAAQLHKPFIGDLDTK
ncbi:hypothetical protein [Burkholderia sp. 22PA0106]